MSSMYIDVLYMFRRLEYSVDQLLKSNIVFGLSCGLFVPPVLRLKIVFFDHFMRNKIDTVGKMEHILDYKNKLFEK